jgi:hypothetical protein
MGIRLTARLLRLSPAADGALKRAATKTESTVARFDEARLAATLRSRTAGPQNESRCSAIHKFRSNVKGAQLKLAGTESKPEFLDNPAARTRTAKPEPKEVIGF